MGDPMKKTQILAISYSMTVTHVFQTLDGALAYMADPEILDIETSVVRRVEYEVLPKKVGDHITRKEWNSCQQVKAYKPEPWRFP